MEPYLAPKDVAQALAISVRTAQRLMKQQAIISFRVGEKLWRTTRQALEAYVSREKPSA